MGRQRVSKGVIVPKKYEKILMLLIETEQQGFRENDLIDLFIQRYPDDWKRVNKRYQEHERLTPANKSHPMPHPRKYIENAFNKVKRDEKKGISFEQQLQDLNTPEPDFYDGIPDKFDKLIKAIKVEDDYQIRELATHKIGKYKSERTIEILTDVAQTDHLFYIRELAYKKLIRFGVEPNFNVSKNEELYPDEKIKEKILICYNEIKNKESLDKLISRFKSKYPKEYDLYVFYQKHFKVWMKNMVKQFPKT